LLYLRLQIYLLVL